MVSVQPEDVGLSEKGLDLYGKPSWDRQMGNYAGWGACALALLLVAGPLIWLLVGVVARAVPNWRWDVLTTSGNAEGGGLLNLIVGTLVLVAGVAILAGTVGILSGVYLAEFAQGRLGSVLRGGSEVLAGIPSIVLGYVGYIALVIGLHWQYSIYAGLIVLSALTVPYIAKSTESALRQVPTAYREGAEGLGMSPVRGLTRITMKTAAPGITTGLLVAMAISVGETAPLLYTANFSNQMPTFHLHNSPVGYLTYAVWTYWNYPNKAFQDLSYDAALILVVLVLLFIIGSRFIVSLTQKHAERG